MYKLHLFYYTMQIIMSVANMISFTPGLTIPLVLDDELLNCLVALCFNVTLACGTILGLCFNFHLSRWRLFLSPLWLIPFPPVSRGWLLCLVCWASVLWMVSVCWALCRCIFLHVFVNHVVRQSPQSHLNRQQIGAISVASSFATRSYIDTSLGAVPLAV